MTTILGSQQTVGSGLKEFNVDAIPIVLPGAAAVTAVQAVGDKVYVGLTGKSHVLAQVDAASGEVRDCGPIFPTANKSCDLNDKIHNSLVADGRGRLIIGQGLSLNWAGNPHQFDLRRWGGGHVFRYDPATEKLEDLGLAVPRNAIHGLTIDAQRNIVSGYTIPDNHFFRFDLNSGRCDDFGKISNYACHNYVTAPNGNVYGAWYVKEANPDYEPPGERHDPASRQRRPFNFAGTYLLCYNAATDRLEHLQRCLVLNAEVALFSNIGIDSWVCTRAGRVFGGTVMSGSVFEVLWRQDNQVRLVGQPVGQARLSGMAEDRDGIVWGTAGMPHMHLFSLDPADGRMTDHGEVVSDYRMCYFHGISATDDGAIWTGETDSRRSILYRITRK